jgi:hypothetical protein
MDSVRHFRLSHGSLALKWLVTGFVVTLAAGYAVSLLQVHNRGSFDFKKTAIHFRGTDEENGIYIPQSDTTMISVAHVHTFTQPVALGAMGVLFLFTAVSEGAKVFWILASFLSSLLMNGSPWLIRDVSSQFVYLIYLAGTAMVGSFFVMALRILYELWWRKEKE